MAGIRKMWGVALLVVALVFSCLALGLAGCSSNDDDTVISDIGKGQTLRVGVRANIAGFGYYSDKMGTYNGLEIDIAKEVARRLSFDDVEFITVTPETRKDMLLNDEVDCVIACYSISDSREENFDFSASYYTDPSVIMVEDSSLFEDIYDMKGCTFGTVNGTNAAPQLIARFTEEGLTDGVALQSNGTSTNVYFDNFHLVEMDTYHDLSDALEMGEIDAVCMDQCFAQTYLWEDRHFLDFIVDTQDYGVATQKDSELSQPVDQAIDDMLADGTMDTLIDKWD